MERLLVFAERVGVPATLLLLMIVRMEERIDALTQAVLALPALIAIEFAKAITR